MTETNSRPLPGPAPASSRRSLLVVALITAAASLLNYVWLSFDRTPPHWDAANHLLSALHYRDAVLMFFQGELAPVEALRRLVHIDKMVYPPLFPLSASVLSPTVSVRSLVMVNSVFLAILLFSVYQIGRRVHSEYAGVLGAGLMAAYPFVAHLQRDFMVDFALLAMTGLSGYLLLASNDFRSRLETVLFGVSTAFGMLAKPTFASFIAVPAAYTLIRALGHLRAVPDFRARIRALLPLLGGLAAGAFLTALWYYPNFDNVRSEMVRIGASNPLGFDRFDANSLVYYFNIMMIDQIGLPFMALLIFGLAVVRKHVSESHWRFLLCWLVGIYVIATVPVYKGTAQDIGILVPVTVISAVGIAGLGRFRHAVTAAVVVFAAAQAVVLSAPYSVLAARIGTFKWAGSYQSYPSSDDWQIDSALRTLGSRPLRLGILSNDPRINGITVRYLVESARLPHTVLERYDTPANELLAADVIIAKSDWTVPNSTMGITRGRALQDVNTSSLGVMYTRGLCVGERPDEPMANVYTRRDQDLIEVTDATLRTHHPHVRVWPLPDGSELRFYSTEPLAQS